ncbi:hypothetical protein BaRGS_00023736, partial [Batillaria attramentaria]
WWSGWETLNKSGTVKRPTDLTKEGRLHKHWLCMLSTLATRGCAVCQHNTRKWCESHSETPLIPV